MKNIFINFLILLFISLFLFGCNNISNDEIFLLMNDYIESSGNTLLQYVENDKNLSRKRKRSLHYST
jgi:hypothetical protein